MQKQDKFSTQAISVRTLLPTHTESTGNAEFKSAEHSATYTPLLKMEAPPPHPAIGNQVVGVFESLGGPVTPPPLRHRNPGSPQVPGPPSPQGPHETGQTHRFRAQCPTHTGPHNMHSGQQLSPLKMQKGHPHGRNPRSHHTAIADRPGGANWPLTLQTHADRGNSRGAGLYTGHNTSDTPTFRSLPHKWLEGRLLSPRPFQPSSSLPPLHCFCRPSWPFFFNWTCPCPHCHSRR